MSKEQHKREVGFKWMPDGSIRAYIISRSDAAAAGELGKILPPFDFHNVNCGTYTARAINRTKRNEENYTD